MKKIAVVAATSLLLAACASTPKPTSNDVQPASPSSPGAAVPDAPSQAASEAQKTAAQLQALQQESVYFDFDQYAVKPAYRTAAQHEADWIRSHSNDTVTLEGNTDDRGSTEYNLALGGKRAHAVHQALVTLGVPSERIKDVSLGEEKPRATCDEEKCWQENRRVDFVHKLD